MKCLKQGDKVIRVSDFSAMKLHEKGWAYCPKSEWKQSKQVT